jgi:hypothetical protein
VMMLGEHRRGRRAQQRDGAGRCQNPQRPGPRGSGSASQKRVACQCIAGRNRVAEGGRNTIEIHQ